MRLATFLCITGLFLLAGPLDAEAKPKEKGGIWKGSTNLGAYYYVVDTNTRICLAFSTTGGLTDVPCELLARSDEWSSIITWIPGARSVHSPGQSE